MITLSSSENQYKASKPLRIVAAMSQNGAIGRNNKLPWKQEADLLRFKQITEHHAVIMGRATFDSILAYGQGPLTNRISVVLTSGDRPIMKDVIFVTSWKQALRVALALDDSPLVIGGETVYKQALPLCHKIYLTIIETLILDADRYFPTDPPFCLTDWALTTRNKYKRSAANEFDYSFETYERSGEKYAQNKFTK